MSDPAKRFHLLPAKPRPTLMAAWALMAALNISAGIVIASWPERQEDLETMTGWGRDWLVLGMNVYGPGEEDPVDYPPQAIVALSPLGLLPNDWKVPVWATFNLLLVIIAPYLAIRAVRPNSTRLESVLPILILLCWGGFRTLLQFSLVAVVFGLLAMVLADRRPIWSGVCLGIALMKPQVALPMFLWAIFTRRFRLAGLAITTSVVSFALVCARAWVSPVVVLKNYLETLAGLYTGDAVIGLAELRPLFSLAVADFSVVDLLAGTVALSLLALVCVFGTREGLHRNLRLYSAPGLAGLWSLLTFYHLTYSFILLLPLAALLLFDESQTTFCFRKRVFWTMQAALMFDVPGLWRRFGYLVDPPSAVDTLASHADRMVMLALFVCVASLARMRNASAQPARRIG